MQLDQQLQNASKLMAAKPMQGFSLTELMVAIAIGSFIALAGTTFYVTTVSSGKDVSIQQRAQNRYILLLRPCSMIFVEQAIVAPPQNSMSI